MRRFCVALALITTFVSAPSAQTPAPSAAAPQAQGGQSGTTPAAAQAPSRPPSLSGVALSGVNIRLEITITDTFGAAPQKKTVAMTIMSGQTGMIRTENTVFGNRARVRLNVDAMATAYASGLISTRLTVTYVPAPRVSPASPEAASAMDSVPGSLEETVTVVLADGKPLLLTESADPATDRKVTLEATATILK